jgi:hypothetical protein
MPDRDESTPRTPARPRLYDPSQVDLPGGFRETTLLPVTHRPLQKALRVLAAVLHEMALDYCRFWPQLPGPPTGWEVRAVLGDLQHAQHSLAQIGRERQEPFNVHERLSAVAEVEAAALGEICARLFREIQAAGVEHWHETEVKP